MKEQLELKRIETYLMRDEEVADIQLQADKIVMDDVKRAMKKELENLNYSTDYVDYLLVDRVKLKAFWQKWLGEDKC